MSRKIQLVSSEDVRITPEKARQMIVGRGVSFDVENLETLSKRIDSPNFEKLLKARTGCLKQWGSPLCIYPVLFQSARIGSDGPVLRKGSRLFENECSFMLGASDIFLPGVFPIVELLAYETIGITLGIE